MVDSDDVRELVPHYLAMLAVAFVVLLVLQVLFGSLGFWFETVAIVVALLLYRPAVEYLGVAPSAWTGDDPEDLLREESLEDEDG